MVRSIEATIDEDGNVRLLEPVQLSAVHRALVTILEEHPGAGAAESALLSEAALAADWNRPEEDEAWGPAAAGESPDDPAQEARRQSLLVSRRRSETEAIDFIEQVAGTRGCE